MMSEETKKENKLYDLNAIDKKKHDKDCRFSKEDIKKLKVFVLIVFGIFITLFLFGGYMFQTYDIEYSDTAFQKQSLEDCYIQ